MDLEKEGQVEPEEKGNKVTWKIIIILLLVSSVLGYVISSNLVKSKIISLQQQTIELLKNRSILREDCGEIKEEITPGLFLPSEKITIELFTRKYIIKYKMKRRI